MLEAVNYSVDILNKLLESNVQALMIKGTTIESSFCLLKLVLLRYFQFF